MNKAGTVMMLDMLPGNSSSLRHCRICGIPLYKRMGQAMPRRPQADTAPAYIEEQAND
jgi:hypothetical protein